jgi:hypothetical protein
MTAKVVKMFTAGEIGKERQITGVDPFNPPAYDPTAIY